MRSLLTIVIYQFLNPFIYFLLFVAGISFLISDARDSIVILILVFPNTIISCFHESRAEYSLLVLRQLIKLKALILRNNQGQMIEARTEGIRKFIVRKKA